MSAYEWRISDWSSDGCASDLPLSLIAGEVTELAEPEREKISVYTNAAGRFGISGLRPGRWRIIMLTEPPLTYILEVPDDSAEVINRSEEHTSELQSLMRISYAVFCLKKKNITIPPHQQ